MFDPELGVEVGQQGSRDSFYRYRHQQNLKMLKTRLWALLEVISSQAAKQVPLAYISLRSYLSTIQVHQVWKYSLSKRLQVPKAI